MKGAKAVSFEEVYRLCGWKCAQRLVKHFAGAVLTIPKEQGDKFLELRAAAARGISIPTLVAEFEMSEHQVREALSDPASAHPPAVWGDRRDVERHQRRQKGAGR